VYSRSFLELDVEGAMGANRLVEVNTPCPPARLRRLIRDRAQEKSIQLRLGTREFVLASSPNSEER
jgi:hypothetical protein